MGKAFSRHSRLSRLLESQNISFHGRITRNAYRFSGSFFIHGSALWKLVTFQVQIYALILRHNTYSNLVCCGSTRTVFSSFGSPVDSRPPFYLVLSHPSLLARIVGVSGQGLISIRNGHISSGIALSRLLVLRTLPSRVLKRETLCTCSCPHI